MKKMYLLVFLLVINLLSCTQNTEAYIYHGKDLGLYTEAINSLLWTNGYSFSTDFVKDSEIEIIEEDAYGRILFLYREKYFSGADISFSSLLVCQKSAADKVYYYEDINFIILEQELYTSTLKEFSKNEIDILKIINDWNQELDLEKCIYKDVVNSKEQINFLEEVKNKIAQNHQINNVNVFMLTKNNDQIIFYGYYKYNSNNYYFYGIKTHDEIDIVYSNDYYLYSNELIEFKKSNLWYNN